MLPPRSVNQPGKMNIKPNHNLPPPLLLLLLLLLFFHHHLLHPSHAQAPNTTGYACTANQTTYPCQTYAFYRATSPQFLDLASIGDLFSVSRRMISDASNISSPANPLVPNQSLFVPISCSCNTLNSTFTLSYAPLNYTIVSGDTFYFVSTNHYQNLTTYQSVEVVNPTLVPTDLDIGTNAIFPVFCRCPNRSQLQNQTNYLISYVVQPSDNITSIASTFGSTRQSIIDVNGNNFQPYDTVFVPVSRIPRLSQPTVTPTNSSGPGRRERRGVVVGLGIGLGICGILLILVGGLWVYREGVLKKRREKGERESKQLGGGGGGGGGGGKGRLKEEEVNLIADVTGCLDKYRLFGIEELREATDGFDQKWLIQGSVYKGCINGEFYAIKKMKWNAYEELKILQKVNHGNLVKLEGFCIDPEEANCYLVYEYVEGGSLHMWLHGDKPEKLSWKARLRIAVDVANGLQYIHEHTRPRVVHKDIKTSNILLDSNFRAKIANFGLAKSGLNPLTMHIVGTQGYVPPEYLSDGVVTTKTDVFSFGVVLLELVSGREAVDTAGRVLWAEVEAVLGAGEEGRVERVKGWMDEGLKGKGGGESCTVESVVNVVAVAAACISKDPTRRPGMVDVVYALCKSDDFLYDVSDDGLSPRGVMAR